MGRLHTVRRGETWHGIAKRLSGDTDPGSLLGRLHRLREVNPGVAGGSAPPEGVTLNVPSEWAPMPPVDKSAAGRERLRSIEFDEIERRDEIIKAQRANALNWAAINDMTGWQFIRWAWRWYWKASPPVEP